MLKPYKAIIDRWVCPDVRRNQKISVAKANKAISDYQKAMGRPEGMAELTVFYCECCAKLIRYCSMYDKGHVNALVSMFEQALQTIETLEPDQQDGFVKRLESVQHEVHNQGWGVGDDMECLLVRYDFAEE